MNCEYEYIYKNEWMLGKAQLYIHAGHAGHPYFEGRERAVNVAGKAWLARTSNVGVRRRADAI